MRNLEDLKAVVSITEIARHFNLEINGYRTTCPFIENHKNNDEHPSMLLDEEKGRFTCLACGAKGDAFDLYMKLKGCVFIVAISELSEMYEQKLGSEKVGRVNVFSDEVIDRYVKNLFSQEQSSVLAYLHARGFRDELIKGFKLGWNGSGITIPRYLDIDGQRRVVGIKIRLFPEKGTKYVSEQGSQNTLYNYQCIQKFNAKTAIIVEGEFDVIAMWHLGYRNVVSCSSGAGSFPMEFAGYFQDLEKIYLFYDNDESGDKGAQKVAELLGEGRCYRVIAPSGSKDANDIFKDKKENAREIIDKLIENATPITSKKMLTLASENPYIKDGKQAQLKSISQDPKKIKELIKSFNVKNGIPTGLQALDNMIGGVRNNYCYLVGADNKVGKSYFILNVMFRLAKQGIPQVYFDLENGEMETLTRMVRVYRRWTDEDLRRAIEEAPEEIDKAVDEMKKLKILYYDAASIRNMYEGKLTVDVIEHMLVGISKELQGCPFFFYIDHLKYFDIPAGKNEYTFYAEAIRRFVDINNNYNSTSFVLVHTRKGMHKNDKDGVPKPPQKPTIEDIAGSHMLSATAKCTLLLWRDYVSPTGNRSEMLVRVASGRSREFGECNLYFYNETPLLISEETYKKRFDRIVGEDMFTG